MEKVGLDFGTSNSAIGNFREDKVNLVDFNGKNHTPSTVFYNYETQSISYGEDAIDEYIEGYEGRIIWSPKNILGTSLMSEKTVVDNRRIAYSKIIGDIIRNLNISYAIENGQKPTHVVCGRPVHFNDSDSEKDQQAEDMLRGILVQTGFKHIEFEYEPIAAAVSYEQEITNEEIGLVVDMGGGTSDFTVIKLSPYHAGKTGNRESDILSVGGVHIAGTNFDQKLAFNSVAPELGLGTKYTSIFGKVLTIPNPIYRTITTWHTINTAYSHDNQRFVEQTLRTAKDKLRFGRLLDVIESRYGHALSKKVEAAKIELSSASQVILETDGLEDDFSLEITRNNLNEAIQDDISKISRVLEQTVHDSGLRPEQIDSVFFTGGSSQLPVIRENIKRLLPNSTFIHGNTFGSVVSGLAILASDIF